MLRIVICEDNREYLNLIFKYIMDIIKISNIDGKIVCATQDPAAVENFLKNNDANLFLLDIDLNTKTSGYELAQKINKIINKPYIVFISEHLEFVFQAFKTRAFDFLPKPAAYDVIKRCILDVNNDYLNNVDQYVSSNNTINIKSGTTIFQIKREDLVFIEKLKNKAIIHTVSKEISSYESLEWFEKMLCDDNSFIRCHKSFIINTNHISEIKLKEMTICFQTGHICFIGRKYKERITRKIVDEKNIKNKQLNL